MPQRLLRLVEVLVVIVVEALRLRDRARRLVALAHFARAAVKYVRLRSSDLQP